MRRQAGEPEFADEVDDVEGLEVELSRRRQVADAHRVDELERERAQARHERNQADVAEQTRRAELERAEREAQARADAELARMYRTFRAAGERTRITSQMARSGEARALRLERLRTLNLKILVPVLLGFAAWSTTGVHHGAARLMGIGPAATTDPMWWALWLLEPVLIGAVVWIIIARARLASAGGQLDPRAGALAVGCLGTSVLLNCSAAIPTHAPAGWGGGLAVVGGMLAHAIGPAGAAATAHLIGVVDESIADADPWTDQRGMPVPLLAEMDLTASDTLGTAPAALDSTPTPAAEPPGMVWPLPIGDRRVLPLIARHDTTGTARRTRGDQDAGRGSKAGRTTPRPRPNKGVPISPSARKHTADASPRALSDRQLRDRLDALTEAGNLTPDASIREVQAALGIGFNRAKRVLALAEPGEDTAPGLKVIAN